MYRGIPQLIRSRPRAIRKALLALGTIGLVSGVGMVQAVTASATPIPPSTSDCSYSNSTTAPNSANVAGVTPGSTITIDCAAGTLPASSILVIAEASGLAGIISPSSAELNETDLGAISIVSSAADGSLHATFTVPASFAAADSNAVCPPTQAQINIGLTCDLVTVSLAGLQPLNEAMITYAGQGTPNAPTLRGTFSVKRGTKTIKASDVPGACPTPPTATSHCWWGAPVTGAPNPTAFSGIPAVEAQVSKLVTTGNLNVSAAVYCQTGATAPACSGLPDGTLVPPALSGTVTTTRGLTPFTINEPNTTPYPGSGKLAALIPGTLNVGARIGTLIRSKG
jgi:hypothetical protein